MNFRFAIPAALAFVAACSTVLDETRTPAVLQTGYYAGEPYEIVTRTMQNDDGSTFERTQVVYRGRAAVCRVDSPRDCELAAQRLINEFFFGAGRL